MYLHWWLIETIVDSIIWLFSGKRQKRIIMYVPKYCRECDVLGICRDENNRWKCRNGCIVMK